MKKLVALILVLGMVLSVSAAFAVNMDNGVFTGVVQNSSPVLYEGEQCYETSVHLETGHIKKYFDSEYLSPGTKLRVKMENGKVVDVGYPTSPAVITTICVLSAVGFIALLWALWTIYTHPLDALRIERYSEIAPYYVAVAKDGTVSGNALPTREEAEEYGKAAFGNQFDYVKFVRYPTHPEATDYYGNIKIFGSEKLLREEMKKNIGKRR